MNLSKLPIGSTIGIIGGGQLGKMMAQSAQRMGFKVVILDPDETCPARFTAHHFIHAAYNDVEALMELGELSDSITYEFENINGEALAVIAEKYTVPQGVEAVVITQNRLAEKRAISAARAKVVPYVPVESENDLESAVTTLGYPFILKTIFGGYDGKGQLVINDKEQLEGAAVFINNTSCVAEQMIELDSEISITATASSDGTTVFFPVQENVHRHQILYRTTVTGNHPLEQQAISEVKKIMKQIPLIGTFTVEFFVDKNCELYVNEIAPRPHNSGHYSIEACDYSQFDTHILAVAGWTLPQHITLHKPAVMYNLLGQDLDVMENVLNEHSQWHVHIYGKEVRKRDRKMGHVTILELANDYETIYEERK